MSKVNIIKEYLSSAVRYIGERKLMLIPNSDFLLAQEREAEATGDRIAICKSLSVKIL